MLIQAAFLITDSNGKEKDDEVQGSGNTYDYGFRIYNTRLGRFLSQDPLMSSFPFYTPYQFSANTPISSIDLDGLESIITINSPWFRAEIDKAIESGDVDRAIYLAAKSVTVERPEGVNKKDTEEIKEAYGGKDYAGTYNRSEDMASGEMQVLDQNGNEIFRVDYTTPEPVKEKSGGFWRKVGEFLGWLDKQVPKGSGDSQPGGFRFVAEGGAGSTGTSATEANVETRDITDLLIALGSTKFGPGGEVSDFNIEEFVNTVKDIIETIDGAKEDVEYFKKKMGAGSANNEPDKPETSNDTDNGIDNETVIIQKDFIYSDTTISVEYETSKPDTVGHQYRTFETYEKADEKP